MQRFRAIAEEATKSINELLVTPLTAAQEKQVERVVEQAVIKAVLEGHHQAIDAILKCPEADQDEAHKMANAVRREHDALQANLSSLR